MFLFENDMFLFENDMFLFENDMFLFENDWLACLAWLAWFCLAGLA